ncbi:hypothetical protein EQV77_03850 [Halobacillus fulvus]|nr:hypothetical protein EQV77_03850 [Halobacillus fulvus]
MTLYTPLSEYDLFPKDDQSSITFHQMNSCTLKCRQMDNGKKQIIQILSTDPKHYMDPSLQPGQWLDS